jgi:hypothetical protein
MSLTRQPASPQEVLDQVAHLCGGISVELPASADAECFAAALVQAAGLGQAGATLSNGASGVARLLDLCDLFDDGLPPPSSAAWDRGWHLRAGLAVLELQGVVVRDRGEAVPRPEGVGIYPRRADRSESLPSPLPLFERWGGALRPVARAEVLPGTQLERLRLGDRVLALIVRRSGGDGEADRRSAWRSWARELTWAELAARLGVPDLEDIEISARTGSGRVVGLVAIGRSGRRVEFEGWDVRRVLDLPESLFSFHRLRRPDGSEVVRFLGRGWGHGVGLCQNGAYGLARSGRRFHEILTTYYSGVEIVRWQP